MCQEYGIFIANSEVLHSFTTNKEKRNIKRSTQVWKNFGTYQHSTRTSKVPLQHVSITIMSQQRDFQYEMQRIISNFLSINET